MSLIVTYLHYHDHNHHQNYHVKCCSINMNGLDINGILFILLHMHHIIDRGDVKQETTNLELLMADSGQVGVTQCITIMCLFIYPMYDHNR